MQTRELSVTTGPRRGLFDLTDSCSAFLRDAARDEDGLLHVFVPHATAGVVVMELGSGSDADLLEAFDRLVPRDDRWRHGHGSAGHGADHVVPMMVPPSIILPVVAGQLALGTWQSVALFDPNPDNSVRSVRLSFLPG
jgi:secondary thiamine-phosphate synthase enzyme